MNPIAYEGLKGNIFYFVSDIISMTSEKIHESEMEADYNAEYHSRLLDYFIAMINNKIEKFSHKNYW